jgi:hypothetical protein
MSNKLSIVVIIGLFLFAGCSEGHKKHRGHHGVRRSGRPHVKQGCGSGYGRGHGVVIGRQGPTRVQRGPYRWQRGPQVKPGGKGPGMGRGPGKGK